MTHPNSAEARAIDQLVEAFLKSEAEQTVRDMARHVGDEPHGVLTRHGMTMKTTAGAIGVGVLAAAQVLGDTLEFARGPGDQPFADHNFNDIREIGA